MRQNQSIHALGMRLRECLCQSTARRIADDDCLVDDQVGHGTHVAGIAAAIDNNLDAVGIAPGARVWAIKVMSDDGSGQSSHIIKGIDYVAANGGSIEVANLSLGGLGVISAMETAISNAMMVFLNMLTTSSWLSFDVPQG